MVESISKTTLDFMQTMPAFVYLIPAVMFFGLGRVPGIIATIIFAMPPAVRLTALGIQQVPAEIVEAGRAFGCTGRQLLFRVQLPSARPSIMAGVNQTMMLALSMVVIASMIGAGGLGNVVLSGHPAARHRAGLQGGISASCSSPSSSTASPRASARRRRPAQIPLGDARVPAPADADAGPFEPDALSAGPTTNIKQEAYRRWAFSPRP